jgi:hypothetical protein
MFNMAHPEIELMSEHEQSSFSDATRLSFDRNLNESRISNR